MNDTIQFEWDRLQRKRRGTHVEWEFQNAEQCIIGRTPENTVEERVDKGDDVKRKRFNKSSCEDEQNTWEFRTEQFEEEDESMSINSELEEFFEEEPSENADEIPDSTEFNVHNAISFIAAFFLHNNISDSMAKDIFTIGRLLAEYSTIRLSEVFRQVDKWSNFDGYTYTYCVQCHRLLSTSKRCGNTECERYGMSQTNVSNAKVLVTYSVKRQIQQILDDDGLPESILNRDVFPSQLSSRCIDTPKYRKRIEQCRQMYPELITLLVSINLDGFARKGTSRGSYWPLFVAVHDFNRDISGYEEYRPEHVLLASIIKSNSNILHGDFESALERFRLELESTVSDPLKVVIGGVQYSVCLQFYQSTLDMEASKKIHGLPIWKKYGSCARCDVKGRRVKLKKEYTISWYPDESVKQYSNSNIPSAGLRSTCLPPPWADGYDALHLINEGTSRDLLRDLLGPGSRLKLSLSKQTRKEWAKALNTAQTPKGINSATLLDPIQLSARTGSEVQQMYNVLIPTLTLCVQEITLPLFTSHLHWLCTRIIVDKHLRSKDCSVLSHISPILCKIIGIRYPQLFSMKFHYTFNHLVGSISFDGSPLLSSAAPYERLNQVLGRNNNNWTTRSVFDMSKRFTALHRSYTECRKAVDKKKSPVQWPKTMSSLERTETSRYRTMDSFDNLPLNHQETAFLSKTIPNYRSQDFTLRSSIRNRKALFATRRKNEKSLTKNCFVYYRGSKGIQYGSIERIIQNNADESVKILLFAFHTKDPFLKVKTWVQQKQQLKGIIKYLDQANQYYMEIVGSELEVINESQLEGFLPLLEFGSKSFASADKVLRKDIFKNISFGRIVVDYRIIH